MNATPSAPAAAYNPWPHALMGFFAVLLLALVGVVWLAVHQPNELVSANYYEQEMRYQGRMDAARRAGALGNSVTLRQEGQRVVLTLPAGQATRATGEIHFFRPSDARQDRRVPLSLDARGRQELDIRELGSGLWRVRVEWSVGPDAFFREEKLRL